jgi:hypothetical protein
MTQPVQETTDQRRISGLDYRTRQLARRPCNSCGQEEGEPSQMYLKIADASTNPDTILDEPGFVTGYYITNTSTDFRYVKLYDLDDDPDVGTDVPKITLGVPARTAANIGFDNILEFYVGIAIATTVGMADDDAVGVNGQDLAVNIFYHV